MSDRRILSIRILLKALQSSRKRLRNQLGKLIPNLLKRASSSLANERGHFQHLLRFKRDTFFFIKIHTFFAVSIISIFFYSRSSVKLL